jgi:hypothetical protein
MRLPGRQLAHDQLVAASCSLGRAVESTDQVKYHIHSLENLRERVRGTKIPCYPLNTFKVGA